MAMESILSLALPGPALALAFTSTIWVDSLIRRDASTIDVFWGLGFVMLAWFYRSQVPQESFRQLLVPILVTIWGGRLAIHILKRNEGQGEDYRYAASTGAGLTATARMELA